jgi:DNA mismatch repair protein PMS2
VSKSAGFSTTQTKYLRPHPLELTASDELIATDNIDILRKNGFEVDVNEAAPSGSRLILSAQPVSKSTVFDVKGKFFLSSACSR